MSDDQPTVTEILQRVSRVVDSARMEIRSSRGPEVLGVVLAALSARLDEAVEELDHSDTEAHSIGSAINSASFAAHAVAEGIGSSGSDQLFWYVQGLSESFATATHPKLRTEFEIIRLRTSLNHLTTTFRHACDLHGETGKERQLGPTPSVVGKLLAIATRFLPATDRARYAAEFRAELADIAVCGSRWAQVVYGVRLLLAAPRLRNELKAPRRQSAIQ